MRHALLYFTLCVTLGACNKKTRQAPAPTIGGPVAAPPSAGDQQPGESSGQAELRGRLRESAAALVVPIHFEFDEYDLDAAARLALDLKIRILRANPEVRVRATGHTDERGSDEYNLALGQRRAAAARRYLSQNGIDSSRIDIESAGEERPLCRRQVNSCWMQNRRVDFEIVAGAIDAAY